MSPPAPITIILSGVEGCDDTRPPPMRVHTTCGTTSPHLFRSQSSWLSCKTGISDIYQRRIGVGNFCSTLAVEHAQLGNYLRYRIQSLFSNDRLLEAFKRIPADYYRMKSVDRRAVTLRRRLSSPKIRQRKEMSQKYSHKTPSQSSALDG